MGTAGGAGRRWFIAVTVPLTVAHPWLPEDVRTVTYLLVSGLITWPLVALLRRQVKQERLPWQILLFAMSMLTLGNVIAGFGGTVQRMNSDVLITIGHAALLAAAISLVLRRGRNDIGGVLDVSVGAMALGGLLWSILLLPRMDAHDVPAGEQVVVLVSILVLAGVLAALARVHLVGGRRLPAVRLLVLALLFALVGNVVLAVTSGSMTTGRATWTEVLLLGAYVCVGLAALHPSARSLVGAGQGPADRLSVGRLVFLGAAMAVNPVVGGVRELAGLSIDGPLLVMGSLLVMPLVMIRVGRLAHQRERAEAALLHQATHDALTGLPNRAELLTRLDAALARERVSGTPSVVLLFCDLNGFKAVNDRLGHLAGDQLLTEVGARIRAGLRQGDTLARYGGDEFLVLCEEEMQQQAVARLGAHIEAALHRPFLLAGESVRISSSVGAMTSDGTVLADELITRADQAMYRAKQRHRADAAA